MYCTRSFLRAKTIIENCVHPDYKQLMWDYLKLGGSTHTPLSLKNAFAFHTAFAEKGAVIRINARYSFAISNIIVNLSFLAIPCLIDYSEFAIFKLGLYILIPAPTILLRYFGIGLVNRGFGDYGNDRIKRTPY